jgi:DNA-binding transcriptional LysR family regulator
VRVNDGEGLVQAALLGLGLAQVPDYFVHDELAQGELTEVLTQARPPRNAISIVYPGARLVPNRVRVLIDAIQGLDIAGGGSPMRPSVKGSSSARASAR